MNNIISIIVPIYKVEKFLRKCIDSIINQTYKNIEIILVDDGSPDSCGVICDEYEKEDNRIRVIHKKNGGLSEARNYGIEASIGKYIMFVDSDDYIDKNMCERLLSIAQRYDTDITMCEIYEISGMQKYISPISNLERNKIFNGDIVMKEFFLRYSTELYASWNKLYKRELFFSENNIRFPVGELYEDMFIEYKLYNLSKRIIIIPDKLYYYIQRKDSITGTKCTIKHINSRLNYIKTLKNFFENVDADIKKYVEVAILRAKIEVISSSIKDNIYSIKDIKKYIRNELVFYNIRKNKKVNIFILIKYYLLRAKMGFFIMRLLIKIKYKIN